MPTNSTADGCPLGLGECPRAVARPPALRMSMEQAACKVAEQAHELRRDDVDPRVIANRLSALVDRMRGREPPPGRTQSRRITHKGRQILVQSRGHMAVSSG